MGQAAGTTAALAVKSNKFVRSIDVRLLRDALLKNGAYLGGSAGAGKGEANQL